MRVDVSRTHRPDTVYRAATAGASDRAAAARTESVEPRKRCERESAAEGTEDGPHLELRRVESPALHIARSTGHGGWEARDRRGDLADEAASGDPARVSDRDLWPHPSQHAEDDLGDHRDRFGGEREYGRDASRRRPHQIGGGTPPPPHE